MKYKGLNDNKITVEAGISNGLIGKARVRGALSQENISKILYKYPDLDANWLLTGQGSMLKSEVQTAAKGLDPPDTGHYKDLAAARLEIIEGLKFKVATLEKELSELKYTQRDPILYTTVAEPAPELIKK